MTMDNCTKTREHLAAFQDDELSCELSYQIQEHLNQCDGCRGFARLEKGFTRAMGARLSRAEVPEGMFDRMRRHLDRVDELGDGDDIETVLSSPASPVVVGPWAQLSRKIYSVAAVLLAGVLLIPVLDLYRPDLTRGIADIILGVRQVDGTIVCFECARNGAPIEKQQQCREQGHHTGILCEQTGLWHLVANESTLSLMSDPSMRGAKVVVKGRFLDDIRYIDARSITPASNR